jgi:arginase family enzyme
VEIPLWDIVEAHENIYVAARGLLAHEPRFFPIFVDHSMTRPIVRALHEARPELERVRLVQFDAHIDCQNFDDGGPHNGTPIRGIIEDDNGVDPRNIVQIGISGGLTPWQAMDALFDLGRREGVVGFDLVEVDPTRDLQGITQRLANKLLLTFLAGFRHRREGG